MGPRRIEVAAEDRAADTLERPDYADAFRVDSPVVAGHVAEDWMRLVLERLSRPARWFVLTGWTLVLGFRLRPLHGTDRLLGWQIVHNDADRLVLEQRSWLLTAHLLLCRDRGGLTWLTFVRFERPRVARPVWAVVGVIHRRIVPLALRRIPT